MGLFGKQELIPEGQMLVITSESIPGKQYAPVGLVSTQQVQRKLDVHEAQQHLIKEARLLGADAIIGFRAFSVANPLFTVAAYGTAVKIIS